MSENIYEATSKVAPLKLGPAVQGSLQTYTLNWLQADGTVRDLTGATITGTFAKGGSTYEVTGTLTVADAVNGQYTWELSEEDVGTPGSYRLFFTATISGVPYVTLPIEWRVLANPAANAVAPPALVGIAATLAAWLSALRTAVQSFTSGNLVANDGDTLTDSGIAATDVTTALGDGGTAGQVWTADGADGAGWQDAAGGGTSLGARIHNSTAITIGNGAFVALSFDSEIFDSGDFHDGGSPTRLTAPEDGLYLLVGQVVWDGNPAGSRELYIFLNGDDHHAGRSVYEPEGFDYIAQQCTAIVQMTAGQYATLIASQTSGGNLDITAFDSSSPVFSICKVG